MKLWKLSTPAFGIAFARLCSAQLPPKTSYKVVKLNKRVREEAKNYDETRNKILNEYGAKKEDGTLDASPEGTVQLDMERQEAWKKEFLDLEALDVEMPTISLAELGDKIELSANELLALEDVITE